MSITVGWHLQEGAILASIVGLPLSASAQHAADRLDGVASA